MNHRLDKLVEKKGEWKEEVAEKAGEKEARLAVTQTMACKATE